MLPRGHAGTAAGVTGLGTIPYVDTDPEASDTAKPVLAEDQGAQASAVPDEDVKAGPQRSSLPALGWDF